MARYGTGIPKYPGKVRLFGLEIPFAFLYTKPRMRFVFSRTLQKGDLLMTITTWATPVIEELSIVIGTELNPFADDNNVDDGTLS